MFKDCLDDDRKGIWIYVCKTQESEKFIRSTKMTVIALLEVSMHILNTFKFWIDLRVMQA
jgi:hypothetical protein